MTKRDKKDGHGRLPGLDDQQDGSPRPRLGRQAFLWVVTFAVIMLVMSLYKNFTRPQEDSVDLAEFARLVETEIIELRVGVEQVRGKLSEGPAGERWVNIPLRGQGDYVASHLDAWKDAVGKRPGGKVIVEPPKSQFLLLLLQMLPFVLLVLLMLYFFNRQLRKSSGQDAWGPFIGNSTQHARKEKPDVTFDDVAGVDEAKEEVQELVEFLKNPEKFHHIGGRIPRGVLLVGAPGTGKTLLAKAVAGEANAPFFSLCGSDFVELFVGVGAARVRDLFRKARQGPPSIIFLDEIDAVGRKRGTGLGGGHDEREQTLNAILSEMDGFARDEGVIVIAATNRPDVLDPALLRPGRFDRQIVVDMPDLRGREAILKVHAHDVKMADGVELSQMARGTPGFTGADLEALVNEAAIHAVLRGRDAVEMADLEEARDKVRFGRRSRRSRIMSEEDRKMTAYHEAGHALVALLEEDVEPLHKVTIIPRGVALGMTMVLPDKDRYGLRRRECLGTIRMSLAGRIAEGMFCGDISSGAENDIRAATELARRMVTQWGMSEELGPIRYSDDEMHVFLGNEITQAKRHSEQMAHRIDEEIHRIVTDCYEATRALLVEHEAELQRVAEALLEVETLDVEQVRHLVQGGALEELAPAAPPGTEPEEGDASAEREGKDRPEEGPAAGGLPRPAESPA